MKLRVGTVAYLNAKPLTWAAEQGLVDGLEAVAEVPSRLAEMLRAGELDAALLSSIVAIEADDLRLLPAAGCLAADGPVQSVLLFSRVHISQVESVALDISSLTSVVLTRILLEQRYGRRPRYLDHAPDLGAMLSVADAALLIGDPGLSQYIRNGAAPGPYDVLDLGREWRDWTGLPFVFAAWIARPEADHAALVERLAESRRLSAAAMERICAEESTRLGLESDVCRHYLTQVMRYDFGPREEAGLARFAALAGELAARREGP